MAAYNTTTLCAAPCRPFYTSTSHSTVHTTTVASSSTSMATASRRRTGCCVKTIIGDCCTTVHPAWTNVRQEGWEGNLAVEGHLPDWLNGTYLRNGPGVWNVGDHSSHHLFDGYATLVRISFRRGHATGAHRQLESDAYKAAMAHGHHVQREFSQLCRPSRSMLDHVRNLVGLGSGTLLTDNANVSVLPLGDGRVLCHTETTKGSVLIDPETLDTIGKLHYTDGLWGLLQCAHPIVTAGTGELLTLLPDIFFRRGHRVVTMAAGSSERKVVGRVHCRGGHAPGWVHSFAVTEKYIVVPEMPLRYSVANILKSELTPLYIFDWLPESGSYVHVLCRRTGKAVASVEVPPFMTFHFINAYEQKDDEDGDRAQAIIADCCEYYADPSVVQELALNRLRSPQNYKQDAFPDARVGRFRIPLDGTAMGELETVLDPEVHGRGVDISSINPAYQGKEYRYVYACSTQRPCSFFNSLTKIDLVEKVANNWHEVGSVPSEPFFVAKPGGTTEDDGVVISIVSTIEGGGYALLVDATTFKEIGRVRFPYGLPFGFHHC